MAIQEPWTYQPIKVSIILLLCYNYQLNKPLSSTVLHLSQSISLWPFCYVVITVYTYVYYSLQMSRPLKSNGPFSQSRSLLHLSRVIITSKCLLLLVDEQAIQEPWSATDVDGNTVDLEFPVIFAEESSQ